ncbi:hypothetical protein GJA_610 [Janthinobacterium agaricidamnosum NBRC 102515 = DSM 9628]|uniref:Uncharacterized protein n=1 Tax=Janthinobacterium agaricidamnosum NBRC 102515 = DSM 9628 TaxID=1349767 RepID=W0UXJ0_9BURK|nr:hypothetical protein GJA_610 [Janthinobacterium agaricidamnosum NBRC 102515 = DSM 9628]
MHISSRGRLDACRNGGWGEQCAQDENPVWQFSSFGICVASSFAETAAFLRMRVN